MELAQHDRRRRILPYLPPAGALHLPLRAPSLHDRGGGGGVEQGESGLQLSDHPRRRYLHGGGIDAELSGTVRAPAIEDARSGPPAGVAESGVEAAERVPAGDGGRRQGIQQRSISNCADLILSPAIRWPGSSDAAGMPDESAGDDLGEDDPSAHRNGRESRGGGSVAQRAKGIGTPAERAARA